MVNPPSHIKLLNTRNPYPYFLFALLVFTFISYKSLLHADFLSYDDIDNVVKNHTVLNLSLNNIGSLFTTSECYNYNPFTYLSYAVEYKLFGMNPYVFHLMNILLHLVNILLVFKFISILSADRRIALVVAVLFALHPIQSYAVSWISARNYLLSTLFYLTSLITYIRYIESGSCRNLKLFLSVLFFILACLSKTQAVTLVLIMILLNRMYKVKFTSRQFIILSVYFVIAVATGLLTLYFRSDIGKTESIPDYTIVEKFFLVCFSLVKYVWKLVYPVELTAIDPFPFRSPGGFLPLIVYLSIIPVIVLIVFLIKWKNLPRLFLFSLLFFTLNILISQFTFFEDGFSANRYAYLSSIGFYLAIAIAVVKLYEVFYRYKKWLIAAGVLILIILGRITFLRTADWKDTLTLANSIIKNEPDVIMAYNIRGIWYYKHNDFDRALVDFNHAISVFPNYSAAYFNRGLIYSAVQNYTSALSDYNRAISINPGFESAYQARGVLMLDVFRDYPKAMADFKQSIALKPLNAQAYYNIGLTYFRMQDVENACKNWHKVRALGYTEADGMITKYCQ